MKLKNFPVWLPAIFIKNILTVFLLVTPFDTLGSDILMSAKVADPSKFKNLNDTVSSYPIRGVFPDGTIQQGVTNRTIKTMPPEKTWPILQRGNFSVLRSKKGEFAASYPSGALLFPGYSALSAKFDAMIAVFQKNPHFIPFFRKVHINVLNQLYHYLMSIYVNFNLQHTGIVQAADGSLQVDIPAFIKYETEYASNKKTLIVNHLMNLIESQFNSSIRSYVPNLPQVYASYLGKTLVHNDYSIDLTRFLDQEVDAEIAENKKLYLQGLATYLDFFQEYTSHLQKVNLKKSQYSSFVDIAEKINQFLYGDVQGSDDKAAIAITKMNPPLFSFNYDDMRALKIIPHLANSLPKNSLKIMWPEHIVQAANEGIILNIAGQAPHPIAYFRTDLGTVVTNAANDPGVKLFICMRSGQNLFEEELIAQPDWLGSWNGVANIMRACFGDFSALVGMEILDPCMESLISLVSEVKKGKDPALLGTSSATCANLIKTWKQPQVRVNQSSNAANNVSVGQIPNLPIANLPTLPNLQLPNIPSGG